MMVLTDHALREVFGTRLREAEPLARYTSARIGGPADFLLAVSSPEELARAACTCWQTGLPFLMLGGGSNVLISDEGYRGVVILNQARQVEFAETVEDVKVRAGSGTNMGALARQCAARGFGGLEWAATVPGTVGGAVVGNSGAHGGDTARSLVMADILQRDAAVQPWTVDQLAYSYRSSLLKHHPGQFVVLSAEFRLMRVNPRTAQAKVDEYVAHRKRTQPPGASMGSMFKNPPGDHAGRLIEAAGLKGYRVGGVQISPLHANFFVNLGNARAADAKALIEHARSEVWKRFGVALELEVELVGEV